MALRPLAQSKTDLDALRRTSPLVSGNFRRLEARTPLQLQCSQLDGTTQFALRHIELAADKNPPETAVDLNMSRAIFELTKYRSAAPRGLELM